MADITVNFMLKSKKAAGASPQTLLLSREGARPLPYPPPVVNIFIRPPFPKILDPPLGGGGGGGLIETEGRHGGSGSD